MDLLYYRLGEVDLTLYVFFCKIVAAAHRCPKDEYSVDKKKTFSLAAEYRLTKKSRS